MVSTQLNGYQLLHNGILAFARAEQQGMRIDVEYCQRKKSQLTRKIQSLEEQFKSSDLYRFWKHIYKEKTNIGSDHQLAHILYDIKKIEPPKSTNKGRGSTDEESLLQLGIPEVNIRLQIDKLTKLRDTYLDAFIREQIDGYIHPFFGLNNVRTFRSSSDHPNLQNIPVRDEEAMNIVRRAIFPRPGHQLMETDFKGIEVNVGTCYHKDPNMIKYIMDLRTDMHRDMAIEIFTLKELDKKRADHYQLRQAAKNGFVFPEFYGDYYKSCAEYIACGWGKLSKGKWKPGQGIPLNDAFLSDHLIAVEMNSLEKFTDHIEKIEYKFWNERFKVYNQWKDRWWKAYQHKGYFDMLTGFRCSGVMSKKEVCNYPIQGSAFHCLLWCFVRIDQIIRNENLESRLVGQIHDSMMLDVLPSECEYLYKTIKRVIEQELQEHWNWIIVPMTANFEFCEIDQSWNTKKSFQLVT